MADGDAYPDGKTPLPSDELFKLLGNDTRMNVLRVFWDEFDFERYVSQDQVPLSFSDLLRRIEPADSGNLNYHLQKLREHVIENVDGGYILTPLGYNLLRSITTYSSFDYRTVDPTVLDDPCPFCDGALVASYEREFVHVFCRDCGGLANGNINYVHCPATDLGGLDLEGMLDAATVQLLNRVRDSRYGFCGRCHSAVRRSLDLCVDHTPGDDESCEHCAGRFGAVLEVECRHCGSGGVGPLLEYGIVDSGVLAFFEERGHGPKAIGPWRYRLAALAACEETYVSEDPVAVTYEFTLGDDTTRVSVTERNDGIDIQQDKFDSESIPGIEEQ